MSNFHPFLSGYGPTDGTHPGQVKRPPGPDDNLYVTTVVDQDFRRLHEDMKTV